MDIAVQHLDESADPTRDVAGFAPVDLYQKREKIFTRNITGRFQRLRLFTGWPLLIGYLVLPWLTWNDRPLVLFDIPARQFHLGGLTFMPQDFMMLGWLLIIAAFGLFTVTSVVGRLWCGYTCPQTIWTSIFMWIEQVAEGTRNQRIKLDQAPWSFEKLWRRTAKHGMWLGWAAVTGVTFVAYFVPAGDLGRALLTGQLGGWALFWSLFFTATTYVNAGWMREQVCIYMCPYARFQSAMVDQDTLVVSYNRNRGEPRGSRRADADRQALGVGDCVDCQLCVQVCPTGIDIRDGLQYQCIDCALCIDACDQIMDKMSYPQGLISYTTERVLGGGRSRILRPRVIGYAIALIAMTSLFIVVLANRTPFAVEAARDRGQLFQQVGDRVRNSYSLTLVNKSQARQTLGVEVAIEGISDLQIDVEPNVRLAPGEVINLPVSVSVPLAKAQNSVADIRFQVCAETVGCLSETSRFFGPTTAPPR